MNSLPPISPEAGDYMSGKLRRYAERSSLAVMAALGITVSVADLFGWLDKLAPGGAIPKITLLILSTVTVVLLLEVGRFEKLDTIAASLANLDIDRIATKLRDEHYAGVVEVHRKFSEELFGDYVHGAKHITILNTWIPNLNLLREDLDDALRRRAEVRILLLHPRSMATELRERALRDQGVDRVSPSVRGGITDCLKVLHSMHQSLDERRQAKLKVRLFNSLPAVSVYRADEQYLVGMFLHGQLAIESPQFEVKGADSPLGRQIQRELDTLWEIGRDIRLDDWQREIDMAT